MPPVRTAPGRASQACDACRARKTRCYESGESTGECLRCSTLRLECSLLRKQDRRPEDLGQHSCAGVETRLVQLEKTVERLSKAIEQPHTGARACDDALYTGDEGAAQDAPLIVIQDAVREADLLHPRSDALIGTTHSRDRSTILTKQILSNGEVRDLLRTFQQHYGRWIGVSEDETRPFAIDDINSALLLCSCCLIAVRHSSGQHSVASALFAEARSLLGDSVLNAANSIEFFQAIILLSLWPTSTGGRLLSMDPWLLTSIAFQHTAVSSVLDANRSIVRNLYIWNHLCLSHLHACISMRRSAFISKKDLEKGRQVVMSDSDSNFEVRMVAEMDLFWIIYEHCVATAVRLPQVQAALRSWKDEWSSLFDQPRSQFLHMSFSFAQLLMYEQSLSKKSAAVRESLLSEMVRLSIELLNTAMETIDERTKYLTDNIYHMIAFAAVTLTRLLYKYEAQLKTRHDMEKADALVLSTSRWLQTIELSSHISHMMGSVIQRVHEKLRPSVQMPPANEQLQSQLQAEDLIIPEFLGMESADFDWDAMIPDWQSLASDEFLSPVNTLGL